MDTRTMMAGEAAPCNLGGKLALCWPRRSEGGSCEKWSSLILDVDGAAENSWD